MHGKMVFGDGGFNLPCMDKNKIFDVLISILLFTAKFLRGCPINILTFTMN